MDPFSLDEKPRPPRKVKFQPKAQARRQPVAAKKEVIDDTETAEQKELLKRLQDGVGAGKSKIDKKLEPVRVAFGYGSSVSSNKYNGSTGNYAGYQDMARAREGEEYQEPWNYYSNYPVTLPLRRPYSGNPETLDEEEFGELSSYDETTINPALDLGLMEENSEPKLLFLQLPKTIPTKKQSSSSTGPAEKACGLNDLQAGFMGKMLVYKSGKVKLKLGDTLYDVTPGSDCGFAQEVVAINVKEKQCCSVGELNKRAVVTPDVDSILDSFADLG